MTRKQYGAMIKKARRSPDVKRAVLRKLFSKKYMAPGHPFRLAVADVLRQMYPR